MFLKNSRYDGLPTVTGHDRTGRDVAAVKLRSLPVTVGEPLTVKGHDQLDVMSELRFHDPTRYWHIADANTELEAATLVKTASRTIAIPKR
jgi:hypothetical protein